MDEPLSNLDAKLRTHTRTELKALQKQLGVTTIFVAQGQAEAMTMGDRIAVLDAGRLQQLGSPDTVYQRPANPFVAQFIGSPPMNIVDARRDGAALVLAGDWRVDAPHGFAGKDGVKVGLRPEAIQLELTPAPGAQPADVLVSEPLGSEVIVNVMLGDVLLKVRTGPEVRPDPGTRVFLLARPEGVRVFDASSGIAEASPGFRGWSGSEKMEFTIDEGWATPPYRAGKIGAGTWHILLGPYKVGPRGCDWKVEIWFDPGIRSAWRMSGAVVGRRDPDPLPEPRAGWLRGDLHCHTLYSDGDAWPQEMLHTAAEA